MRIICGSGRQARFLATQWTVPKRTYLEQRREFETADQFDRQYHVVLDTARELDACLDDALATLDERLP
jgi:hypothetical protein